jgi:hypothetical protein
MRRADAREGSHTDFTDDATAGERLLAGLLHLEPIDTSLCAPWIDRIFAIIVRCSVSSSFVPTSRTVHTNPSGGAWHRRAKRRPWGSR